jgi:hypothetical protein
VGCTFDDLWATRVAALSDTRQGLQPEANLLAQIFALIDQCLDAYEKFFINKTQLATVSAVITLKGRNLALGCVSIILDCLGQEAGALFRPLLEAIELLRYLRVCPGAVEEATEDRLPSAGKIAKTISGNFRDMREYLNEYAAHTVISYPATRHLIDFSTGKLQKVQPHQTDVLRTNLATLFAFISMLAIESVATLRECSKLTGVAPVSTESLVNKIHASQAEGHRIFFPEAKKSAFLDLPSSAET